jgi:hypothetical protein
MATPKSATLDYIAPDSGTSIRMGPITTSQVALSGLTARFNLPSFAVNPIVAVNGDMYYNTVSGKIMIYSLGAWVVAAQPAIQDYAMFYGLTTGTGNADPTDYAGTVAVKTVAGTGRVPFPRNGPTSAVITRADTSSFTLPAIGTYHVVFRVHTTEAGQLQLELNGTDRPETVATDLCPTAGGHLIVGDAYVTTSAINQVLAVVNCSGNVAALTITPADANHTHANAQSITITKVTV